MKKAGADEKKKVIRLIGKLPDLFVADGATFLVA